MRHSDRIAFTPDEAGRIRQLLAENVRAGRDDQKRIREEVRKIGFYISHHKLTGGPAFSPDDFDGLIRSGEITVR